MFDFSDVKQKSALFGLQHQNEDLFRKSFLGKLSPVTGGFMTEKNAFYLYTGVQVEYELGILKITVENYYATWFTTITKKGCKRNGHAIKTASRKLFKVKYSKDCEAIKETPIK